MEVLMDNLDQLNGMDNMENNDNMQETLNRLKQNRPAVEVGGDFENQVFAKIKHKKKQRKVTVSATIGIVVVGFVFLAQSLFLPKPTPLTDSNNIAMNSLNTSTGFDSTEKEEIPVLEDVVFASSDAGSDYVVEQVGASGDDNSI